MPKKHGTAQSAALFFFEDFPAIAEKTMQDLIIR
jgi:hypothetical protein